MGPGYVHTVIAVLKCWGVRPKLCLQDHKPAHMYTREIGECVCVGLTYNLPGTIEEFHGLTSTG